MSTSFQESLHPRGAAGRFVDKVNDAPTGALIASPGMRTPYQKGLAAARELADAAVGAASRRAVRAQMAEVFAEIAPYREMGATRMVVTFDEDDFDGPNVDFSSFTNDAGDVLPFSYEDGLELYAIESNFDMECAGFEQQDGGLDEAGYRYWTIEIPEPPAPANLPAEPARGIGIHVRAELVSRKAGFADAMLEAAGADQDAHTALESLGRPEMERLAARYEAFLTELRAEMIAAAPSPEVVAERANKPF